MQCCNCGEKTKPITLIKNGKQIKVSFCSLKCYIQFWEEAKNFEPLKEKKNGI